MKKKLFAIAIVFGFNSILAQSNSVKEAMKFYPLDNGNYWEYGRFTNDNYVNYPVVPYYWLKVMGDTVFSNGNTYKKIQRGFFSDNSKHWRYERIDTTTSSVYRIYNGIEYKIDSLLANPGDNIVCSRFHIPNVLFSKCLSEVEDTLFNQKFIVKNMQDLSSTLAYKYKLVKGLGYCYSESRELVFQGDKLLYAIINGTEYGTKTDIVSQDEIPNQFIIYQNYPNPFNPSTTIKYTIPFVESRHTSYLQRVTLKVYDILGREIATLVDDYQPPGLYSVPFSFTSSGQSPNSKFSTGVYFYQLKVGTEIKTKKMLYIK